MTQSLPRGLFLDRDGVINEEIGYLVRSEEVRFVPGIFSLCRTAHSLGYRIFIVTNQAGIARGFYTEDDFQNLMRWMLGEFSKESVSIDAVYHCPYHPVHGIGEYKREHEDRKPGIGMLARAEREFGISLAASVLVGDRCTDIAAANSAGLRQAFLLAGSESGCVGQHVPVNALAEVEKWLIGRG
jgi:D-glycero-D-manno-heptose 1,7-bisphosphate phosphatase